ncbi:MAG: choice-of-anchor D domain-containing protein, partial [Alphaproteobacteria bacterium]|nr:choice-of-anchor D domain-containing protein [Alphaproteobacteria bacterium]
MRYRSALVLLLAAGCGPEYKLDPTGDGPDIPDEFGVPDIEVDREIIDFGALSVGDGGSLSEVVSVSNVGDADLHIRFIELSDPDAPYTVGAVDSVLVPPGQATTFIVTFTPETAALSPASVLITSDDPDEVVTEVRLLGEGAAPVIDVSPQEYDFGTLYVGCDSQQRLTVSNLGNELLVVEAFQANTASPDLLFDDMTDSHGPLPWEIEPGGSLDV